MLVLKGEYKNNQDDDINMAYLNEFSDQLMSIKQIHHLIERKSFAFIAIGMEMIFKEKLSVATQDRPELQKMLESIQHGDIIFVTELTRITRNTRDLFELVDYIKQKKANLQSLKDTWLDLSEDNPYSQSLMTVMGGVNQLERDLIRMRQCEGSDLAKKEGKYRGRVKKYQEKHAGINYTVKLYREEKMTVKQICEITNVSRSALYRRLSEMNN